MSNISKEFEFVTELGRIDMTMLADLYESVGFGKAENYHKPSVSLEKLFGPGIYGFFVFHGERLIGMARVMSDDILCTWIAEICVHPDWQKKGIGSALLEKVDDRFRDTALYADVFKGQEALFSGRGINPQSRLVACGRAPLKV